MIIEKSFKLILPQEIEKAKSKQRKKRINFIVFFILAIIFHICMLAVYSFFIYSLINRYTSNKQLNVTNLEETIEAQTTTFTTNTTYTTYTTSVQTTTYATTTTITTTTIIVTTEPINIVETEPEPDDIFPKWDGDVLNAFNGSIQGPSGTETYYNLPMGGVVSIMRDMGFDEESYPYWVREDGVKMLGDYVMCAADLDIRPRGSLIQSSLGAALVCDTGSFVEIDPERLDIAVNW